MAKAKVITMMIELNQNHTMNLVITVNPIITPEMVYRTFKLSGYIIGSEESDIMPLPYALEYASAVRSQLGIN